MRHDPTAAGVAPQAVFDALAEARTQVEATLGHRCTSELTEALSLFEGQARLLVARRARDATRGAA